MSLINIQEPSNKKLILAIDFGTTNTSVFLVTKEKIELIKLDENELLPSVVHYENKVAVVGKKAKDKLGQDHQNTIYSIKRILGQTANQIKESQLNLNYQIDNNKNSQTIIKLKNSQEILPLQVASDIFLKIKKEVQKKYKALIKSVVITTPAYFDDKRRGLIQKAANLAGLSVMRLINEPTAACVAYGIDKQKQAKIGVFDLGGGTFDVSILALQNKVFKTIATGGDPNLGGDDFDNIIFTDLLEKAKLSQNLIPKEFGALKQKANFIKESLTKNSKFQEKIELENLSFFYSLTQEEFKEKSINLLNKTLDIFKKTINDAKLNAADLDEIVLVGGASKMPFIKDEIFKNFSKKAILNDEISILVAKGAAIYTKSLLQTQNKDLLLLDVTPLSLGLETMGGIVQVIIPRNSQIPIEKEEVFTTFKDNQTKIKINIIQGERELAKDCFSLGEFEIRDIEPKKANLARIQVTFSIDTSGVLSVKARDQSTNKSKKITIKTKDNLSQEQIKEMIKNSHIHAKEDINKKKESQENLKAKILISDLKKALVEDSNLISKNYAKDLESLILKLERKLTKTAENEILQKTKTDIKNLTQELEIKAYDFAKIRITSALKKIKE